MWSAHRLTLLLITTLMAACQTLSPPTTTTSAPPTSEIPASPSTAGDTSNPTTPAASEPRQPIVDGDPLWTTLRAHLVIDLPTDDPRIVAQAREFARSGMLNQLKSGPRRYLLQHVADTVLKRNLPAEFVFLPFVESEFTPSATSLGNAGMWQVRAPTARMLGLKVSDRIDERFDAPKATDAALDYLEKLRPLCDNDWLFTLVAYNIGDGTLGKLRAGRKDATPWELALPQVHRRHIEKLAGLWLLLRDPTPFDFQFPALAPALPLRAAEIPIHTSWMYLAKRYGVPTDELRFLNGAARDSKVNKGQRIWVASSEPLAPFPEDGFVDYKVRSGDSLWKVARRFSTSVIALRDANSLTTDKLRIGSTLKVPTLPVGG